MEAKKRQAARIAAALSIAGSSIQYPFQFIDQRAILANKWLQRIERDNNVSDEEWLTVEEVAALLKVSTESVRRYITAERLQAVRLGGQYRIKRAWVNAMLMATR